MFACNKSFASLFNFQAYYCFSVDVDAIQLKAVRDWNNMCCFNGCVSHFWHLCVCIYVQYTYESALLLHRSFIF